MSSHPVSLFIGTVRLLPGSSRATGMFKAPVATPVAVGSEGFAGDQQADRQVHGGPEKAVHLYPAEHYARLAARFPDAAPALVPGSLGENISCQGLSEADVCLGDVFTLGSVRLQLSQPRSPCWKIDTRFDCDGMAAFIAESSLTGWYFRVLQAGTAGPGDRLALADRVAGSPTLAEAMSVWRAHRPALADLERIAAAPALAPGWRRKIEDRAAWLHQQPAGNPPAPPLVHARPKD